MKGWIYRIDNWIRFAKRWGSSYSSETQPKGSDDEEVKNDGGTFNRKNDSSAAQQEKETIFSGTDDVGGSPDSRALKNNQELHKFADEYKQEYDKDKSEVCSSDLQHKKQEIFSSNHDAEGSQEDKALRNAQEFYSHAEKHQAEHAADRRELAKEADDLMNTDLNPLRSSVLSGELPPRRDPSPEYQEAIQGSYSGTTLVQEEDISNVILTHSAALMQETGTFVENYPEDTKGCVQELKIEFSVLIGSIVKDLTTEKFSSGQDDNSTGVDAAIDVIKKSSSKK